MIATVALELTHHGFCEFIREGAGLIIGRDDMVDGGEGAVREPDRHVELAKHGEGLGARDFVNEVGADEQLRLARREFAHCVCVPDFFEEAFRAGVPIGHFGCSWHRHPP